MPTRLPRLLALGLLVLPLLASAQKRKRQDAPPKLIVALTVDQMRADYLTRYADGFGLDGFVRLIDEGFMSFDHHFSYAPTYTGPGHASIATGTTPAVHGIIGNNWYSRTEGRKVCAGRFAALVAMAGTDPNQRTNVPGTDARQHLGRRAQTALHLPRLAPIVIGASMKDCGAILLRPFGGRGLLANQGDFITSNHYPNPPRLGSEFQCIQCP